MPDQSVDQLLEHARGLLASLKKEGQQALTLPAPFAEMVAAGKVTLIIADKQMDIAERDLLLADSEAIYGEVRLKRGKPISLAEFRKRQKEHRIPDEERKSAWPTARRLFAFQVESVKACGKPYKRPKKPKQRSKEQARKAFEAVMKGKRRPTAPQLTKLREGEADISVFAELCAVAPALAKAAEKHAQTTIELMEPGDEAGDILFNVAPMAELLGEEFGTLAKAVGADASEGPGDECNAFVLAGETLEALQLAEKLLPEKSRQMALTKAGIEVMEALLELEPDFQEASRCPTELMKYEMTTGDVPTAHQPNPPPPKEPQAPKECVCPNCGHKEKLEVGDMCSGKKCPECGTPMKRNTEGLAKSDEMLLARLDDLDSTMINPGWIKNTPPEKYEALATDQLIALKAMLMCMLRPDEQDEQLAAIGVLAGYEGFDEGGFPMDVEAADVKKALGYIKNELAKRDIPDDAGLEAIGVQDTEYETQFVDKAVWSTAYVNTLPDSAFLYIAPGGKKDGEGKTVPRSLRYFPVRDDKGKLDLPHLRNAIARIPQSNAPGLTADKKSQLQDKARRMLAEATQKGEREELDSAIIELGGTGELEIMDLTKAANAFVQFTGAERVMPAVFQLHFRGKAAHGDLRIKVADHLVGYTLALQQAGKVSTLADMKAAKGLLKQFGISGSAWNKSMVAPAGVFAALKNPHPAAWLKVHNRQFEPGEVGATAKGPGFMFTVAKPRVTRGFAGEDYHEYFCEKADGFQGRLVFAKVLRKDAEGGSPMEDGRKPGSVFWKAMFTDDLLPYVVSARAVHKGQIGPKGWSLLPPQLKAVVPANRRYWQAEDEKERKQIRRALVKERFFTRQNIKMVDGELRKVKAKYYLYHPEQEADVGKREEIERAVCSVLPAPPTASQDNGGEDTSQEKTTGLQDFVTELKKAEASVRAYIRKASVRVFKYHTVDGVDGEEERYIMGEVLVPDDEDTQGDEYDENDVRKAAHFFAEHGFFAVGLMHERTLARSKIRVLESYLAPVDMTIEGRDVKKGTWLMAARVLDDDLWQAVKDGRLTGWSIEGTAIVEEIS